MKVKELIKRLIFLTVLYIVFNIVSSSIAALIFSNFPLPNIIPVNNFNFIWALIMLVKDIGFMLAYVYVFIFFGFRTVIKFLFQDTDKCALLSDKSVES